MSRFRNTLNRLWLSAKAADRQLSHYSRMIYTDISSGNGSPLRSLNHKEKNMKNSFIKIFTVSSTVLFLLIFPACNMTPADSLFTSMANGSKLPVEFAIASGDVGLMLGCLSGLNAQLDSSGLSETERGEIALDMIDLLAVLSNAMVTILPYLLEGAPPIDLIDIGDFYDSANVNYLISIAEDKLIEYGINADPAPMQLFWGALGMAAYEYQLQGNDWTQVTYVNITNTSPLYDVIIAEAELMAVQGTNPYFLTLLDRFRALIGDPN